MKDAPYVEQKPLSGITPFAEECLKKIRALLPKRIKPDNETEKPVEREPGSDDEDSAW